MCEDYFVSWAFFHSRLKAEYSWMVSMVFRELDLSTVDRIHAMKNLTSLYSMQISTAKKKNSKRVRKEFLRVQGRGGRERERKSE